MMVQKNIVDRIQTAAIFLWHHPQVRKSWDTAAQRSSFPTRVWCHKKMAAVWIWSIGAQDSYVCNRLYLQASVCRLYSRHSERCYVFVSLNFTLQTLDSNLVRTAKFFFLIHPSILTPPLTGPEAENIRTTSSILSCTSIAPSVSQYERAYRFLSLSPPFHQLLPFMAEVHLMEDINSAYCTFRPVSPECEARRKARRPSARCF